MTIEKSATGDKYYPYEIIGGWGDKVYCTEENLIDLKKQIEEILDSNKNRSTV